jgi:hypothetical protein
MGLHGVLTGIALPFFTFTHFAYGSLPGLRGGQTGLLSNGRQLAQVKPELLIILKLELLKIEDKTGIKFSHCR